MMTHPATSTPYHTVWLPVAICEGGMKLSEKASSEPAKPMPAMSHMRALPRPSRAVRSPTAAECSAE